MLDETTTLPPTPSPIPTGRRASISLRDRTRVGFLWYRMVQWFFSTMIASLCGLRATGRENIPGEGGAMLVSNHLSHLDVLVLGILLDRPLNYVARSTLFFFPLGRSSDPAEHSRSNGMGSGPKG